MNLLRRKSQTYPVALAIISMIAAQARAQLCLSDAEKKPASELTAPTGLAALTTKPQQTANASASLKLTLAPADSAEIAPITAAPQTTNATTENSSRPQTDLMRSLLLAAALPARTEANLPFLFLE